MYNFDSYSFFFWQLVNHNDVTSPPPPKCKQKGYCHTFFNILWFEPRTSGVGRDQFLDKFVKTFDFKILIQSIEVISYAFVD